MHNLWISWTRLQRIAEEEERKREEGLAKAEVAARAAEGAAEIADSKAAEETEGAEAAEEKEEEGLKLVFPPLPTHSWEPPPEVPAEKIGTGANAKVQPTKHPYNATEGV